MTMRLGGDLVRIGVTLVLVGSTGCNNDVVSVDGSGSTGSGGSGSSGSGSGGSGSSSSGSTPTSREISVTLAAAQSELTDGVVFQNRADGSLVASWKAADLPVLATVQDGDLVTYGRLLEGQPYHTYLQSHRVTASTTTIHEAWTAAFPNPTCVLGAPTHVVAHVPAVPGVDLVRFMSARTGYQSVSSLPADVAIDASVCPGEKLQLLLTLQSLGATSDYVDFQYWSDVEPQPGQTIDLVPTFDNAPRKALPIQISGVGEGMHVHATAHWTGLFASSPLLYDGEQHVVEADGPAAFLYAPKVLDLPPGFQVAWASVSEPLAPGACMARTMFTRFGGSDAPLSFDVSELARPERDGNSWKVGPGALSNELALQFASGQLQWTLLEDPHGPALPSTFPTLPALPAGYDLPSAPPLLLGISHERTEGMLVDTPDIQHTVLSRRVDYDCD